MINELCHRCGIHTGGQAYCRDCIDVEQLDMAETTIRRTAGGARMVTSTRRAGGRRLANRDELLEQVRVRTIRGETAVEIALAIGVTSRTVVRWRRLLNVHGASKGVDHWDYERRTQTGRVA